MQKISPCLWFDGQAEAAADFYVSVFRNARKLETTTFPEGLPRPAGSVLTVRFVIDGLEFTALNGGPEYLLTPAVSFTVIGETQAEADELWEKLTAGGEEGQCGWLKDKFGVSWQIIPKGFHALFNGPDPASRKRVAAAMLTMRKLDLDVLRRAAGN